METFALPLPQLQIWAITTCFLFAKMFSNTLLQGYGTYKSKRFYFKEDAELFGKGIAPNREETEFSVRASACWENDQENIPIFLFLSLAFALVGASAQWLLAFAIVFCVSRVLQAAALMTARQPLRNLAYQAGILCCAGLIVGIVRTVASL